MQYLHIIVVGLLIFINSVVASAVGLFHLSQPYVVPPTLASSEQPGAIGQSTTAGVLWISVSKIQATSTSGWAIQNGSIVYDGAVDSDGNFVNRIVQTDPNEFMVSVINPHFGKSMSNVYYDGAPISGADANSFTVLGPSYDDGQHNGGYAEDRAETYYEDSASSGTVAPISGANAPSFSFLGFGYAKDSGSVYLFGDVIPGADPETFTVLGLADSPEGSLSGDTYAKDKNHVYLNGMAVPSYVDVSSFALVYDNNGQPTSYAKDKNHVYNAYDASIINGANPTTFIVLNSYYAKDKYNVYSFDGPGGNVAGTSVVSIGANPATFRLVSGITSYDATDGKNEYDRGWPVKE
jgi:hypothetical protein